MGIIVRPMTAYGLPTHLRVNMGLPEENERFLQGLRQAL
jgi:histidinol-phosphate aminotransferase